MANPFRMPVDAASVELRPSKGTKPLQIWTWQKRRHRIAANVALLVLVGHSCWSPAFGADMTVRQVTEALFRAMPNIAVDFAGRDLRQLDLSGLDFKGARLAGADLFGVDLAMSDLSRADLVGARLDRAIIIKADFSNANMVRASLQRPSAFSSLAFDPAEAPRFVGANLSRARIIARLDGADFTGANLAFASLASDDQRSVITTSPRVVLIGCNFSGASLKGADLAYVIFTFAKFRGADLSDSILAHADLSKADLSGADLSNADMTDADLDGAILTGARGLDTVKGLSLARNLDRSVR
jgi:uncharacterized protein YjbI with pentapeptide repeats